MNVGLLLERAQDWFGDLRKYPPYDNLPRGLSHCDLEGRGPENPLVFRHNNMAEAMAENIDAGAGAPNKQPDAQAAEATQHEMEVEEREAFEYWGYLFKPDKTGTDKLKSLLRGLKDLIVRRANLRSFG